MSTIVVVVLPTFLKILVLDSHCDIVGRYHLCVIFFLLLFLNFISGAASLSEVKVQFQRVPKLFSDSRTVEEDSLLSSVFCQDLNSGNFHSRA